MNSPGPFLAELRQRSLAVRTTLLGMAVSAFAIGLLPVAASTAGWLGAVALATAAVACLLGASLALLISERWQPPEHVLIALLLGMLARMGFPLGVALSCLGGGRTLADAGLLYYLLVFFPLTLTIETMLSLPNRSTVDRLG
jgi:hypothetical protein